MSADLQKHEYIDALRGLAILGVMAVHAAHQVPPSHHALLDVMKLGSFGVQLFYVASAFTLCMSWDARASREDNPVRNFLIRRFFRIAPLFWLAIVFYLWLFGVSATYWAPHGIKWWFPLATALFIHGLHPETINSVVPGGWSIAVEMGFYALLPFLLRRVKTVRERAGFVVLSLLVYNIMAIFVTQVMTDSIPRAEWPLVRDFIALNLLGQLPVFAFGVLGYSVLQRSGYSIRHTLTSGVAVLIVLSAVTLVFPAKPRIIPVHCVAGLLFTGLTLVLQKWPVRILVNPLTRFLGTLSFACYVAHFAVIYGIRNLNIGYFSHSGNGAALVHWLLVSGLTVLCAMVLNQRLEKPMMALGKSLIRRLEKGLPQPI